ncbi:MULTISPECIES: deacetylase SIR2 [Aerococcus]|uniref:Deacetylase SIR2 n=1 Tax=Aerococcus sanguinicola TaxID=119206 RepID=A0A5N1GLL6_9LACT|nr:MULTISPECIES: deacetylase SIR2 [Aerococcus]KAA9301877.1 deacetylase SIR2 [Aerococcus sanguinicola]MDK6368701.1 deacetylase SIR2 [Aerococcus sp. UMB9870]MDK6679249.1 deacetylase SIR2 [Aerococcus sp. UMB8608]MDK6685909.1 deacetylase SIR2 [Aerococcus sp. UMB8623]MDK6939324.1 deacetylase SIR2 [Aerococcus sp. UMB8487]
MNKIWKALQGAEEKTESELLAELFDEAEALVIGIGAGMSAADGFTYVGPRFKENFPDFIAKYGLFDMLQAFLNDFESLEEYWAFQSRFVKLNGLDQEAGDSYLKLRALLKDKNYHIITSNADNAFEAANFDLDKVFYYQGKYVLFQCSKQCQEVTYRDDEMIREMVERQEDMKVPSQLIPYCPNCGAPLEINKRDTVRGMVEDAHWHDQERAYLDFLAANEGKKVLYLEIGIGHTTPELIREPFQEETLDNPQALYVMMNQKPYHIPSELADQSLRLTDDLAQTFAKM